jgi:hypothetical protein
MSLSSLQTQPFKIEILTEHYQLVGMLEVFGMLSTYLNQNDRLNYQLKRVSIFALDTASTMAAIQMEEVWIRRDEIVVLRILEGETQGVVQRLPVAEKMRLFLTRYVVQGTVLRGTDANAGTLFESQAGAWAGVAEAQIYPLAALKSAVFQDAPLLLVNKRHIRFYEVVKEQPTN